MGLFSKPPPPPAALTIHLSPNTPQILRPNDILSGTVTVSPHVPLRPLALELSLYGTSTVYLRTVVRTAQTGAGNVNQHRYLHWRDNAPLFDLTTNVLPPGSSLAPNDPHSFPFEFRVPAGTGNERSHAYKDPGDTRWTVSPHELPPTFSYGNPRGWDDEGPDWARVEYAVRARLVVAPVSKDDRGEVVEVAPVFFAPLGRRAGGGGGYYGAAGAEGGRAHVFGKNFTLQSSALLAGPGEKTKVGFRQGMRDRFSSKTPKLEFEVRAEVPDVLVSGGEFKVDVVVEIKGRSEHGVRVPRMSVRLSKLDILDFTFVRAARDRNASPSLSGTHSHMFSASDAPDDMPHPNTPFSGREHTVFEEQKTRLNTVPETAHLDFPSPTPSSQHTGAATDKTAEAASEKKAAEARKEMDGAGAGVDAHVGGRDGTKEVQRASFWARVPGTTVPSFRSFAITRAYRLRGRVVVEAVGKEFEVDFESEVGGLVGG